MIGWYSRFVLFWITGHLALFIYFVKVILMTVEGCNITSASMEFWLAIPLFWETPILFSKKKKEKKKKRDYNFQFFVGERLLDALTHFGLQQE